MATIYASPDIRHTLVDGLVVLLDLRVEKYIILNRAATSMWRALLSIDDPQERISRLENAFEIDVGQLARDLEEFTQDCLARGYLQCDAPARSEPTRVLAAGHTPLAARAWWSLVCTASSLRRFGFSRTYRAYSGFKKPVGEVTSLEPLLARSQRAFSQAENFFLMKSAPKDCLPRSLALYRFLLSAGIPADHVIGVRQYPFEAHAWVEYKGLILFDFTSENLPYTQLSRL